MAKHKELPGGARLIWSEKYAQMIAAALLGNALDVSPASSPFFGDDGAATIGRRFFEAGGFRSHEAPQHTKHVRELRPQNSK